MEDLNFLVVWTSSKKYIASLIFVNLKEFWELKAIRFEAHQTRTCKIPGFEALFDLTLLCSCVMCLVDDTVPQFL